MFSVHYKLYREVFGQSDFSWRFLRCFCGRRCIRKPFSSSIMKGETINVVETCSEIHLFQFLASVFYTLSSFCVKIQLWTCIFHFWTDFHNPNNTQALQEARFLKHQRFNGKHWLFRRAFLVRYNQEHSYYAKNEMVLCSPWPDHQKADTLERRNFLFISTTRTPFSPKRLAQRCLIIFLGLSNSPFL